MRYWLSIGDGKTYGPYEIDQIRAMQTEGRVPPASQLCAEGSQNWVPASQVLAGGAPSSSAFVPPASGTVPGSGGFVPVSLVGPILVTVFCCLIGGIISIVYAANANTKAARGDLQGAMSDARTSRIWMWVSIGIGVVVGVLYIVAEAAKHGRP